jgi:predicted Zn-dependent peptidase
MDEDKYYPLVVGCSVLGGGPHSKMFENIREKESLCYYIYSSVEKYKAILFISSGIEIKNYDKTLELINEQINSLKNLDITDEELENSKMAMINSMKSVNDNIGGLSDFYFAQSMAKTNSTIEKMIENISKVTKEEIAKVACEIELDTIYFLRN